MTASLSKAMMQAANHIEKHLETALAGFSNDNLIHAMRYAVQGGKRLRGFLVLEGAAMLGVSSDRAIAAASAAEAMHAYSLVHDDLPPMDNDDLRRGRPTIHIKWDEATAILTGDALQALAFELLCDPMLGKPETRMILMHKMTNAAGAKGMVLGQTRDIAAEITPTPLTLDEITCLQSQKTGALIRWSGEAGPLIAGEDPEPMSAYATALGQAFQIADDILDVTGNTELAGKRLQKDEKAHKATFVAILGLEGAQKHAKNLIDEAIAHLSPYGNKAQSLIEIAHFVISRKH